MNDVAELRVLATAEKPDVAGAVCRINVATAEVARTFETRARVAVVATFANGYVTRTSLMPRRGVHILPLRAEACAAAGIRPGDTVTVTLREDGEPRTLEIPHDLIAALNDARLHETFDAMSYSHRKEWALAIADAKRAETRTRAHTRLCRRVESQSVALNQLRHIVRKLFDLN